MPILTALTSVPLLSRVPVMVIKVVRVGSMSRGCTDAMFGQDCTPAYALLQSAHNAARATGPLLSPLAQVPLEPHHRHSGLAVHEVHVVAEAQGSAETESASTAC